MAKTANAAPAPVTANAKTKATATDADKPQRLLALDAYRGLVMLALASGGLGIAAAAPNFPDSRFWHFLGYQFEHVDWVGCSFWDMIQPSFMFLVGVSMAYSCASRAARGQSYRRMLLHAVWRSVALVLLGVFLRSASSDRTNWTFTDVVSQIGLGYVPLFLLWNRRALVQLAAAIAILAGYWYLFYSYPLPPPDFDRESVGVEADWQRMEGNAAHWEKNTNPASAADRWLLNRFPRPEPFRFDKGGYATLNFVPSLATMIFGLLAAGVIRSDRSQVRKLGILTAWGIVGIAAGIGLHMYDMVPIVKRIWTPSWVLFSSGITTLVLAAFYAVVEVLRLRRWTYPLVVVGANSILIYCMSHLSVNWIVRTLQTHLGRRSFELFGPDYEPLVRNVAVLAVMWLVCWWLYRQRIFVRI